MAEATADEIENVEAPASEHHEDEHHDHVMSPIVLVGTWLALMALTGATVGATSIDIGPTLNLALAMLIAVAKAMLVALIFMHLWFDQRYNIMIFFGSVMFVVLFIAVTFIDASNYRDNIAAKDNEITDPLDLTTVEAVQMPDLAPSNQPVQRATVVTEGKLSVPEKEHNAGLPFPGKPKMPRTAPTVH